MNEEDFDPDSVEVSTMWRFTGVPTTVGGLHSSVLVPVLFLAPAAWMGIFKPVALFGIVYVLFAFWLNMKWKISPVIWLKMQITRFVKGNRWPVR